MKTMPAPRALVCALLLWWGAVPCGAAQDERLNGSWRINLQLSQDMDRAVERSVRDAGGTLRPPPGTSRRTRGRYRGGPPEEAFYDHLAYADAIEIRIDGERFEFRYPTGLVRQFSMQRTRTQSASGTGSADQQDFSFGYWDGEQLLVESMPRDYGRAQEQYRILPDTGQLEVRLSLQPAKFVLPVEARLVYDRAAAPGE